MSFASPSKKVISKEYTIDLLILGDYSIEGVKWEYGRCDCLGTANTNVLIQEINLWAKTSQSDYLLLWEKPQNLPEPDVLFSIIAGGVDFAHCGLKQGLGTFLEDLCVLGFSWDKLNASPMIASTSWRLGLETCLIRRKLFLDMGGLDSVFHTQSGAGLEFGYRSLKLGAIIEYHPEMYKEGDLLNPKVLSGHDFYCFVLRHFRLVWGRYVFFRRLGQTINWINEIRSWQSAYHICKVKKANWSLEKNSINAFSCRVTLNHSHRVSVVIPTVGRYKYIPGALKSLLEQTIPVYEVIVVDQNPPAVRNPEIYKGYEGLNLHIIWQEQLGQGLARNAGLAAVKGEYVLLFDDDSIAYPDLIEHHLEPVLSGRYDASTGVAIPPQPTNYTLPPSYQYPRLSQTFDTGNSLMRLELAHRMGGLDQNFDFGPGVDADFGTRLYLAGYRILHNPNAIRVHYKAPSGGLRIHGAHKYNTDAGLLQPFPPVTLSYYALRYLSPYQRRETALINFLTSKFPPDIRSRGIKNLQKTRALFILLSNIPFYPFKYYRSVAQARKLLMKGPQLSNFETAI